MSFFTEKLCDLQIQRQYSVEPTAELKMFNLDLWRAGDAMNSGACEGISPMNLRFVMGSPRI